MIGGRQTYPSFEGTPLFPFGHGLSYASFGYGDLSTQVREGPFGDRVLHGHQHRG